MFIEVLSASAGLNIDLLELRNLPYTQQLVDVMKSSLPLVTVSNVFINGIASGHGLVHLPLKQMRGLRHVSFLNADTYPNARAVLKVCASRKIPNATLEFSADVKETKFLGFLFYDNSPKVSRQFAIMRLNRPISRNFFRLVVKKCRRNVCESLRFGLGGLLTDPTDARYSRYVVERDKEAAMYKFGIADRPFTIVVGKITRFYLTVFQGNDHELCTSLAVAKEILFW
ncbi:hypothetical protein AAVH_24077 [Aphelenchoides avenae]|nr:hypothetical protein AAVH_24077 [Aphelenchus avenae]